MAYGHLVLNLSYYIFYIHISFPFLILLILQSVIRSSGLPHCGFPNPYYHSLKLMYCRSAPGNLMFRSKINCEKLALYILHTIKCNFKVWHFANVKSTGIAIDLPNFQERRQCGFLSMIILTNVRMMWWHRRHPITKIEIFARIPHMLLMEIKRTTCVLMHFPPKIKLLMRDWKIC